MRLIKFDRDTNELTTQQCNICRKVFTNKCGQRMVNEVRTTRLRCSESVTGRRNELKLRRDGQTFSVFKQPIRQTYREESRGEWGAC